MAESDPDRDVQRFLLENLESHEQLRSLLLIAKAPDRDWTAQQVADALKLPPASAHDVLQHLSRRSLLKGRGAVDEMLFTYVPEQAAVVQRLDQICGDEPHVVMKWMNANALERVRSSAIKTFADAFLLRKKKPDG